MNALRFLLVLLTLAATPSAAAVLQVANNGLDGPGCGTKAAPCRSITRAITDAAAGDTIVVGPGRYGDLDRDGTLGETGEEGPAGGAVVAIDKAVTVLSRDGAAVTVIDVAGFNRTAVRITAGGVRFGKAKKGFTIFDSSGSGVSVESATGGCVVEGNLALLIDITGFNVTGDGTGTLLLANVASAGATGFVLSATSTIARNNLALANVFDGFAMAGDGSRSEGNVASANVGDGYSAFFHETATIAGGAAVGNRQGVFGGNGEQVSITGLAVLGNRQGGVHNQGSTTMTLAASNLIGNGAVAIGGSFNCGVINENHPLTAGNVFWGAATGPGDDPADAVCDGGTVATTIDPIATKPFKVKTKVAEP